jgi:exodeoxyribonuclease-3
MRWFERLIDHAAGLIQTGLSVMIDVDFNVIPTERYVRRPERWLNDALFAPEVRSAYFRLLDQGWTDALRTIHSDETIYTFWKYWRGAFERNDGLRIDHLLLSPVLSERLVDAQVDTHVRGWEKSSDHAPAWVEISD